MLLEPDKVVTIILAACALHNFLRTRCQDTYTSPGTLDTEEQDTGTVIDGEWRETTTTDTLLPLAQQGCNMPTLDASEIRNEFCDYFNTNGLVELQWDMV